MQFLVYVVWYVWCGMCGVVCVWCGMCGVVCVVCCAVWFVRRVVWGVRCFWLHECYFIFDMLDSLSIKCHTSHASCFHIPPYLHCMVNWFAHKRVRRQPIRHMTVGGRASLGPIVMGTTVPLGTTRCVGPLPQTNQGLV